MASRAALYAFGLGAARLGNQTLERAGFRLYRVCGTTRLTGRPLSSPLERKNRQKSLDNWISLRVL